MPATSFPIETTNSPGYMLLFRDASPEVYDQMTTVQRERLMDQWNAWYEGLATHGKVQHGHPLQDGGRVVSGPRGERVMDGPYSEAKEAVGGYFFLNVESLDEATEIAQRCPSLPHGMIVEVRPVADACATLGVRGRPATAAAAAVQ
jgi:hypothetical protein